MSDEPVTGDGVVTIPHDHPTAEEVPTMAGIDPTVAQHIMTETVGNIQANNRQGRDTFTIASGSQQLGAAKTLNELGPVESRAVSGVLATPVASPTTQSGQ